MTTSTPKRIYLIGPHHGDFVQKLAAEDYEITSVNSYASIKPNAEHITAIVIIGHDDDFANVAELKKLLDAGVVLMAFEPSPSLLKGLHEASETIVDIENIDLPGGSPIMIHRVPEDDTVYISIPSPYSLDSDRKSVGSIHEKKVIGGADVLPANNLNPDQQASTSNESDVPLVISSDPNEVTTKTRFDLSIFSLGRAIDRISAVAPLMVHHDNMDNMTVKPATGLLGDYAGLSMVNKLRPSFYTKSFKKVAFNQYSNPSVTRDKESEVQDYIVDMTVTFYSFAANADPTNHTDFEKKGGEVYVIAIHSGSVIRNPKGRPRYISSNQFGWFVDSVQFGGEFQSYPLTSSAIYPERETSVSNHLYRFSNQYEESIHLFSNDRLVGHQLHISEDFNRQDFRQTAELTGSGYSFSIDYNKGYDAKSYNHREDAVPYAVKGAKKNLPLPDDNMPLHGIFVAKTGLGKPKFATSLVVRYMYFQYSEDWFDQEYTIWEGQTTQTRDLTFDLTFKT